MQIQNLEPSRSGLAAASEQPSPYPTTGARALVGELVRHGVQQLVGIPGGAILPLYDALGASPIRHVLARHEQGAAFIAQGMARASGRAAVCLATSGPGATNLITALADALADSVPLVAITAQVPRALIGTQAFQEVDTCALAAPVTKACYFVDDERDLTAIVREAFAVAESGRRGPVLIDVPKDVLSARLEWQGAPTAERRGAAVARALRGGTNASKPRPRPRARVARSLDARKRDTWWEIATMIAASRRPVLFVGGGIGWARAEPELALLAARIDAAVACTLHGLGAFPGDDSRNLGMLGMHGHASANRAMDEADLVLALGVRFDDRATGDPETFCPKARIVHVDVDASEIGKLKPASVGVTCDARRALRQLLEVTESQRRPAWHERIARWSSAARQIGRHDATALLAQLQTGLDADAVVTTDVGQHQMWVAQHLSLRRPQRLLTSGGLGTMGFGLPAALGAALEQPGRQVVCVTGDGSLWMNLQELATLAELDANVCVLVLNNAELGMVRQQQSYFYAGRHAASQFATRTDFAGLARSLGLFARHVVAGELSESELRDFVQLSGPRLLDVQIRTALDVLPMVPPGGSNSQMLLGPPDA